MIRLIIFYKNNKVEEHDFTCFEAAVCFLSYPKTFENIEKISLIEL